MEVTCSRHTRHANVLWNVEQVVDARRKSADVQLCFFSVYILNNLRNMHLIATTYLNWEGSGRNGTWHNNC